MKVCESRVDSSIGAQEKTDTWLLTRASEPRVDILFSVLVTQPVSLRADNTQESRAKSVGYIKPTEQWVVVQFTNRRSEYRLQSCFC